MLESLSYYLIHLLTGFVMLGVFMKVYMFMTPFDEMALINRGVTAAALSLGGATIGFSLTIASSIMHTESYVMFVIWGIAGMVVQLVSYLVLARVVPDLVAALEADNVAIGLLAGTFSIAVGLINAGCMS